MGAPAIHGSFVVIYVKKTVVADLQSDTSYYQDLKFATFLLSRKKTQFLLSTFILKLTFNSKLSTYLGHVSRVSHGLFYQLSTDYLKLGLTKYVTDGLYKIGQFALVTARFGPKDCQFGPQEPSIEVGMLKYKFAQMGAS